MHCNRFLFWQTSTNYMSTFQLIHGVKFYTIVNIVNGILWPQHKPLLTYRHIFALKWLSVRFSKEQKNNKIRSNDTKITLFLHTTFKIQTNSHLKHWTEVFLWWFPHFSFSFFYGFHTFPLKFEFLFCGFFCMKREFCAFVWRKDFFFYILYFVKSDSFFFIFWWWEENNFFLRNKACMGTCADFVRNSSNTIELFYFLNIFPLYFEDERHFIFIIYILNEKVALRWQKSIFNSIRDPF